MKEEMLQQLSQKYIYHKEYYEQVFTKMLHRIEGPKIFNTFTTASNMKYKDKKFILKSYTLS